MINKNLNRYANRLVNAFLKNKIISPLPVKYTKKISEAQKLRRLCESKIKKPISGFKAAGTGIPVLKKLNENINTTNTNASLYLNECIKKGWVSSSGEWCLKFEEQLKKFKTALFFEQLDDNSRFI